MCDFFSLRSDGNGKVYYFNAEQRKQIAEGLLRDRCGNHLEPDSHTSIGAFYGFYGEDDDMLNKYEYNPITGELVDDTIVSYATMNDHDAVLAFCKALDFNTIVDGFAERLQFVNSLIGKRIRVNDNYSESNVRGRTGTIKGIEDHYKLYYARNGEDDSVTLQPLVEFDEPIPFGHDGHDGLCQTGYGWYTSLNGMQILDSDN